MDNLFESYQKVTKKEFVAIWIILILAIFTSLVIATAVGVGLAALIFVIQAGRQTVVRAVLSGTDFQSTVVRSLRDETRLAHLARLVLIVKLQRYIFFGSANQVLDLMKEQMHAREALPPAERQLVVIFDFQEVEDIDYTGVGVFHEMLQGLQRHGGQGGCYLLPPPPTSQPASSPNRPVARQ